MLSDAVRSQLERARAVADGLVLSDPVRAAEELEAHNDRRIQVWGPQVGRIRLVQGPVDHVLQKVGRCIEVDFALGGARELSFEQVETIDLSAETRDRLDQLLPAIRERYEKSAAKRRESRELPVRKVVLTTYFAKTFGLHEIVRIGGNEYLAWTCSDHDPLGLIDVWEAAASRTPAQAAAAEGPVLVAAPPTPSEFRKPLLIAGGVMAALVVLAIVANLVISQRVASQRKEKTAALASLATVGIESIGGNAQSAATVGPPFFEQAGITPQLGRFFTARDFAADQAPVVVISDALWSERFQRAPSVVGSRIDVAGQPHTIIGVAPFGFSEPGFSRVWLPAR